MLMIIPRVHIKLLIMLLRLQAQSLQAQRLQNLKQRRRLQVLQKKRLRSHHLKSPVQPVVQRRQIHSPEYSKEKTQHPFILKSRILRPRKPMPIKMLINQTILLQAQLLRLEYGSETTINVREYGTFRQYQN